MRILFTVRANGGYDGCRQNIRGITAKAVMGRRDRTLVMQSSSARQQPETRKPAMA
ncbi:hypothetical protein C4K13_2897 [Pseudomonas chlororaphis subsp. aureofaciens]|nr:hypothetical protein C4K13_2897 [Pseudomonas chlororaphis subsp. aureofaciens]AZD98765.1 hypothetical protein C4K12_2899 [Pseudomonas chlororaphis subsp. aureofaciens]